MVLSDNEINFFLLCIKIQLPKIYQNIIKNTPQLFRSQEDDDKKTNPEVIYSPWTAKHLSFLKLKTKL